MLREQRPFKFFNLPATYMKEFVREAKGHGLLYVPIRNKQKGDYIELVVFADDAAKIQRIPCLNVGARKSEFVGRTAGWF